MALEPDLFIPSSKADYVICDQLNDIFIDAVTRRVSDVHFKEDNGRCNVRFRMPGGEVWLRSSFDHETARIFDSKIRARAKLPFNEREAALGGRMSFKIGNEGVDVRVELSPGVSGQLIACRMLHQSNSDKKLKDFYMSGQARLALNRILREPDGLFIVTGPTGSGKTTLLYSVLNELYNEIYQRNCNIVTIEDPVEYSVPHFHQMRVTRSLSFSDGLRSALRQDPDVIMVGEIRDPESASIAIQAANTGHLVFSTMHANSAAETIDRFMRLGIDPLTVGSTLRGVSAQRLLQTVTEDCPRQAPTPLQQQWLAKHGIFPDPDTRYPAPQGKQHLAGYVPVMELMLMNSAVQLAIPHGTQAIVNAAARQGQYETLAMCGERLAAQGVVPLNKVIQITSSFVSVRPYVKRLGEMAVLQGIMTRKEMWDLVDFQAQQILQGGDPIHLGKLLIQNQKCTPDQVVWMAGYTSDAREIMDRSLKTEKERQAFLPIVQAWIPGEQSLFDLVIKEGLCEKQGIYDAFSI